MGDVGAPELLIILVVILVLFGGAKLPEFARSLGRAKKEFHQALEEDAPDHDARAKAPESTAPRAGGSDDGPATGTPAPGATSGEPAP